MNPEKKWLTELAGPDEFTQEEVLVALKNLVLWALGDDKYSKRHALDKLPKWCAKLLLLKEKEGEADVS